MLQYVYVALQIFIHILKLYCICMSRFLYVIKYVLCHDLQGTAILFFFADEAICRNLDLT